MKIFFPILSFLLFLYASLHADYNYRDDLTRQLNIYKADIEFLNKKIEDAKKLIKQYEMQLSKINDSIVLYTAFTDNNVNPGSDNKFFTDEVRLIKTRESIEKMKADFHKRILWLYKHGSDYNTQVLFSSKSLNDFYVRLEYLNKISEMRKKDFDRLKRELSVLEEKKRLSKMNRDEYSRFMQEKKDSRKILLERKSAAEKVISELKDEIEMNGRQIERKLNFTDKIERELFNYNVSAIYKIDQSITYKNLQFGETKGRLIFPVQSVNIISDFGKSTNPETKSVSYNNGMDVSVAKGSEVRCIADGKVELIYYIPYFGNVIIINHDGNYRSVYAIVKDINVSTYQIVRAGSLIARTGENNNGQCFHFELWKDNSPLDPKLWIKRGANINEN
ncbi:MAG: peptidoglycan DD-metalloendopeptidase family protein [Ignavibacteriae bacterium]|nr:peptidoglycan DD-metalloendopeptidase family protein [Ignavibacteriota bacterium]